ncbi:hypothetical protein BO71DRAFT_360303 [Aspergillus ellipticus CBS 707.79]|uniref:Developmental regulatory protein wetA n=1 Tax=Aspergillus ellipticus CBS 707.79 TaxID=1448320 RepID=A0A319D1Q0_9EURO|nr:hypothetical protein BO71DRAFT_360303 [Aspergillus ellipticus CBS 707.79]
MFAQPFDHSFNDLFNQYVNMDNAGVDGNKDVSFPGDLDQIFQLDSLSSDCGEHSSPASTTKQPHPTAPAWSKDFWCLPQDADSSAGQDHFSFQQDTTVHPSAVSDLSVNHLETPQTDCPPETHSSPSTPPATPSRKPKSALVTPKSIRRHREPNDRRALMRKQSFSPSLSRSSQVQRSRMAHPEAWQRFQNFGFRNSDDRLPLSPPPSDIIIQQENFPADNSAAHLSRPEGPTEMASHYDSGIFNQSPAISMPSPSANALARQQQRYLSQSNNSTLTSSSPPSTDDIFSSPHSSDPQSMSSWHSDSLGSSGIPYTPELHGHESQAWWSPMTSRVAQRQPSYQQMVTSPAAQRPVQNPAGQNDMLQGGLMIQLDPSSFDLPGTTPSFASCAMPSAPNGHENRSYSHSTTAPVDSSSFMTPQVPPMPSRSPSLSPGSGSPKSGSMMMHNGNGVRTPPRRSYGRKLSSNSMTAPKPVKGLSGSSGSPKGSNRSVTVSFVNFTAHDSQKILGGVAPSGSSKTKARREQEARDRRRKLSEAALLAVRRAGGDVEALEAILC